MSGFDAREFWGERWSEGRIGFHQPIVHPTLEADDGTFLGGGPHRVLVPLSGKSLDVPWLAKQGHAVVGVEIVRDAVEAMFVEHGLSPRVEPSGSGFEVFHAERIEVWCGDFFALPVATVPYTRVWDRAAIVAVPPDRRGEYAAKLRELAPGGLLWLTSIDYDAGALPGPPNAVSDAEVMDHFPSAVRLRTVDLAQDASTRWAQAGLRRFDVTLWSIALPSM